MKPYYQDKWVTIYHGDCREILPQLDVKVDLVLTDPPYGITNCEWDKPVELSYLWGRLKQVARVNCAFVFMSNQPFATDLINSNRKWFRYEWIWSKKIAGNVGLANKMPLKTHENIMVFYESHPIYNPQFHHNFTKMIGRFAETSSKSVSLSSKVKKLSGQRGFPRTILEFMRPNNMTGGGLHSTQKPTGLIEYLIKTYSGEDNLVLDPFLGSGTTCYCAKKLNRYSIGIEIEEKYCEIAAKRCSQEVMELGV